jgi:hypothetical protein
VPSDTPKIRLSPELKKPATNSDSQTLTLDPPPFPPQCIEPINETTASLTLPDSNPRSTTDGTSSSALQSQHMLAQLITQTYPSPQVHKHTIESDFTPRNLGLSSQKETQSGKDLCTSCLMQKDMVLCSYFAQRSGEWGEGRGRKSRVEEAFQGLDNFE